MLLANQSQKSASVMGQYYLLANVTKSQGMRPILLKALDILASRSFQPHLALLLLDFGQQNEQQRSLESSCLEYLAQHDDEFTQDHKQELPSHMQQRMKTTKLTQLHVGAWAGDRLIITGDYSDHCPFPPDGKWENGNLFGMISGSFADCPDVLAIYRKENKEALHELRKLCEDKLHYVVNLDLKEYLDPRAYGNREKNVLQFADRHNAAGVCMTVRATTPLDMVQLLTNRGIHVVTPHGVMTGLLIKLIHSTGAGGGDLPSSMTSRGTWAGCRVKICAAEDVEDFESYKDVSNAEDVKKLENLD